MTAMGPEGSSLAISASGHGANVSNLRHAAVGLIRRAAEQAQSDTDPAPGPAVYDALTHDVLVEATPSI